MESPRVFISSTSEDLTAYRAAARDGAIKAGFFPHMMEYFDVQGRHKPYPACMLEVATCQKVILIVAHRYGWKPEDQPAPGGKSITWLECEQALREGKEVLAFIVDEKHPWPAEFRESYRLAKAIEEGAYTPELAADVAASVKSLGEFKKWAGSLGFRPAITTPESLKTEVVAALSGQRAATDPRPYLEHLSEETRYIDIRGLQAGQGEAKRFPINELYIPLVNESARGGDAHPPERMETRVELEEALANPRLVVVGDPGSGKSTFLKRVAHNTCQALLGAGDGEPPFPMLVRVSELIEFIEDHHTLRGQKYPAARDLPAWAPHFLASRCTAIGDGYDEAFFRGRLQQGPALLLLDGLDEAPGERTREEMARLVERAATTWPKCRLVVTTRPAAYRDEVTLAGFEHARIGPLEDRDVRVFLERWSAGLYPESPAQAKDHAAELVLALRTNMEIRRIARNPVMLTALAVLHWNERRLPEQRADLYESILKWLSRSRKRRPGRLSPERCLDMLQELAWAMHSHAEGRQVQAPRDWAAGSLAPHFREVPKDKRKAAAAFLADEEEDSGIIVSRGKDVRFWHLTFQEFLAARVLARHTDRDKLLFEDRLAWNPDWRETILLMAGVVCGQRTKDVDKLFRAALDRLFERRPASLNDRARYASLLGAMLRDLRPFRYSYSDPDWDALFESVMGVFDANCELKIQDRLEVAEALGQAGDPRLEENNWVAIPGANFKIGRYPVTVQEYRKFLEADGYRIQAYWKQGGFGNWTEPGSWDTQIAHPTWPVMRVSWFEAAAYCEWAEVRLPTEAEWERAARGVEGRKYPWGNEEPDKERANYRATGIGHPTPVGLFPRGATPDTLIHDMAGNVWEWVHDRYDKKGQNRVLRGGSWINVSSDLVASVRVRSDPVFRNDNIGFRCARE